MANDNNIQPEADDSQIVLYQPDDSIRLEVKLDQDTVWLTQAQMTELFRTTRNNITMHIRNIFKEKELDEKSVCKESLHTAADGKQSLRAILRTLIKMYTFAPNFKFGTK